MDISKGAKLLYLAMLEEQKKQGEGFSLSLAKMSRLIKASKPTLIKYRKQLVEAGLLEEQNCFCDEGGRLANKYSVKEVRQ